MEEQNVQNEITINLKSVFLAFWNRKELQEYVIIINLTEREIEVLRLVCRGYTNKRITKKLYISTHTVKAHISSIMYKLKAKNRTETVYKALKQFIIE